MPQISKKISIIVPVYNGAKTLHACLSSLFIQEDMFCECIIVDNNSTDTTKEIVMSFKVNHPKIVYIFEAKKSRGAARNAGIMKATGDIIMMTDADCVVPLDWVEKLSAPILSGKESVVVGSEYDLVKNYWSTQTQKMDDYLRGTYDTAKRYTQFIDTKNVAIRTHLLKKNLFDSRFKALEDQEIVFRLRQHTRFFTLKEVQVGHKHAQTIWSVIASSFERSYWFAQIYHKYAGVYDKNGILIFPIISPFWFYVRLPLFDTKALITQGWKHLPYFFIYDITWKIGTAIGYANKMKDI